MRTTPFLLRPVVLAAALAVGGLGSASAQTVGLNWNPRTGDVWVNTWLADMNQYGYRYQPAFIDEMNRYYGVPRDYVGGLLGQAGWAPGDVYMACAIAHVLGRPCNDVVDHYNQYYDNRPGQGWGVIAQRMGIKPGSSQFHRLKAGMVRTYDRWDRPIVIDRDLERDFPNRGKGHATAGPQRPQQAAQRGNPGGTKAKAGPGNPGKAQAPRGPGGGKAKGPGNGNGKAGGQGNGKGHGKGNAGGQGNGKGHGKGRG